MLFPCRYGLGLILTAALLWVAVGCARHPWNDPYPAADQGKNILYSSFEERPKHLDPARSYSSNEYVFIGQIYEPPLAYHYLKRPYELVPLTAIAVPQPEYLDAQGRRLAPGMGEPTTSVYRIRIREGIRYQPHPALARDVEGRPVYLSLTPEQIANVFTLRDFQQTGTRELTAEDYVHQIKRLANPSLHSPIFGVMADLIIGFRDFAAEVQRRQEAMGLGRFVDLVQIPLEGVRALDRYTFEIRIRGKYPQFLYWLAMPFFAPMPPEADRFYAQPGLAERNISLDWYPVGTGPYMLTENNPNRRMVLEKNPNFHGALYPTDGSPGDREAGLLEDAGKPLPFVEKVVYSLEKETIPYWNKFLQGYYDVSAISSESFDQAVQIGSQGQLELTDEMKAKGIRLSTAVAASTYYMGFNMRDPVVGGLSERARKLRQAIAIAVDFDEYIAIFLNGRGIAAQGPIPPGIFGHREGVAGVNPIVYRIEGGKIVRRSIGEARELLAEAGYPGGVDENTGEPLTLYYDTTAGGSPGEKAILDWYRKQFQKLNLQLVVRSTLYNQFQEKMRKGTAQIFSWGWNADYPDPENFMFLLYGPNGKVESQGENAANYINPAFDALFEKMKNMENGPERQAIIDQMTEIARHDSPWLWGLHPKEFSLHHAWYKNAKPNLMAHNTLMYRRVDPQLRDRLRQAWNQPRLGPIATTGVVLLAALFPAYAAYRRKMHTPIKPKGGA